MEQEQSAVQQPQANQSTEGTQQETQSGNFQGPLTESSVNKPFGETLGSAATGIAENTSGALTGVAAEEDFIKKQNSIGVQAPDQNFDQQKSISDPQAKKPELEERKLAVRPATSGRIVVFFPGKNDTIAREDENESVPAIVVKSLGNNQVNLRAFTSGDAVPVYKNVPHKSDAVSEDENAQYWDWPEIK